jgi:hypothetical protein
MCMPGNIIQWGSENRTSPDYEWSVSARTGHPGILDIQNLDHFPVFKWSTSLDCFIKKRVITNILFLIKRSSP